MGSPQMNFVDGVVKVNGSKACVTVAGIDIPLTPAKAKAVIDGGYNGKTVTVGIRPEHIADLDEETIPEEGAPVFQSKINVRELLGAEVFLYFDIDNTPFTARVNPRTKAQVGDTIKLAFDIEKIHLFDKDQLNFFPARCRVQRNQWEDARHSSCTGRVPFMLFSRT